MISLKFSCDHVAPQFARTDETVTAKEYGSSGLWYVSARGYGCSRNAKTPEIALRNMLLDHACTNIRIERV